MGFFVRTIRTGLSLFLLATGCFAGIHAEAQVVLAQTATLTAARESVRVYLQQIRLGEPEPSILPIQLPGTTADHGILLTPDGYSAFATTRIGADAASTATLTGVSLNAPRIHGDSYQPLHLSDGTLAGLVKGIAQTNPRVVMVGTVSEGPVAGLGQIEAWAFEPEPYPAFDHTPASWLLPGVPRAAVTSFGANWVAVLCLTPSGATVLHVRDMLRGRVLMERMPVADPKEQRDPAVLSLHPNGKFMIAVFNDAGTEDPGGDGRCWAIALDARSHGRHGDPIELPGNFTDSCQIEHGDGDSLWITTRSPGAGFAFVTQLAPSNGVYVKRNQFSFTNVTHNVRIAASGERLAVAVDRRLAIWPTGVPGDVSMSYPAPITSLAWAEKAVVLAEANRVHAVQASDGAELSMCILQSGHVIGIRVLPPNVSLPIDSDRDRIPDPVDPDPAHPSPVLDVPSHITLREEAAGREVRAIMIDSEYARDSVWTVDLDPQQAPWLRVFPRHGEVPGWFLAGIDPSRLSGEHSLASLNVTLSGASLQQPAAYSPQTVTVSIRPRSPAAQQILWLLGNHADKSNESKIAGYRALSRALAGPPFYFSHVYTDGRAPDTLDPYGAVVVETYAVDRGIVNRQTLLDYVADGGGLLLVAGQSGSDDTSVSQRWLAPLGIVFDGEGLAAGDASVVQPHPLTRHWPKVDVSDGSRVQVTSSLTVLAEADGLPVFAIRPFGRGRIAVLAAPQPLLEHTDHPSFQFDLFEWLSRAVTDSVDIDDDGLPDAIEDRNENGIVDPGETSRLNPDSDGDGLPDGAEDQNADGIADENETSPIQRDTDADGNWDGADYDPLPPVGTPTAVALVPNTGPAEGGTRISIDGRNLTADAAVWFGANPARVIRVTGTSSLLVESPPADSAEGGRVDVRVEGAGAQGAVLNGGFTYTPRSTVTLSLAAVAASRAQYEGLVTLRVDPPPGIRIGRISMRIDSDPPRELEWFDLRSTPDANLAGRRVIRRDSDAPGVAFDITAPSRTPDARELVIVGCRSRFPLNVKSAVALTLNEVLVTAPNGAPLNVELMPAELKWTLYSP